MGIDPRGLWSALRPDADGLVVAVVQDDATERVLMVGYMNEEALGRTLQRGRVTFWSRSRQALWEKGETSGHTLHLRSIRVDCDGDALLVRAHPVGPTCHTGKPSCFFRRIDDQGETREDAGPPPGADRTFSEVFDTIEERKAGRGITSPTGKSYVRSLLEGGVPTISAKIREEAEELCTALERETDERVANEAADLLFHALVALGARGLHLQDVAGVLARRHGLSGIDEKNRRK